MLHTSRKFLSAVCRVPTYLAKGKNAIRKNVTLQSLRSYSNKKDKKSMMVGFGSTSTRKTFQHNEAPMSYSYARYLSSTAFSSRTSLTRPALEQLIERVKSDESMPINEKIDALKKIGDGLLMMEKYNDGIEYYRRAIEATNENDRASMHSDLAETYFALGYALHAVDDLQGAQKALEKVLTLDSQHDRAYNQLGMVMAQLNKNDEAKALLERAISINNNNLQAHNNLGNLYQTSQKWSDAVYHYQLAVNVLAQDKTIGDADMKAKYGLTADDLVNVYVNLAMANNKSRNSAAGLEVLNQGLDRFPENPRLLVYIGEAYEQMEAAESDPSQPRPVSQEAMLMYRRALGNDPENIEARVNIGMLQLEQRNERAAEVLFLEAVDLAKKKKDAKVASGTYKAPKAKRTIIQMQGELQYNNYAFKALANLRHRQGKSDQAIQVLKDAIDFEPNEATAYYQLGVIYHEAEKPMESMSYLTKALKIDPTLTDGYVQLGICLANVNKPHEAISCFRKAVSIDPNHWAAHLNLSTALMEMGLTIEGQKHQDIAFSLYPPLKQMMSDPSVMAQQEDIARERMQETKRKLLTEEERQGKLDTVIPLEPSDSSKSDNKS
jgi:tetratricopeptide (TPR) repeat protein